MDTPQKFCPACNKMHPLTEFYKNVCSPDGLATYCKTVMRQRKRDWRNNPENKEKMRAQRKRYLANVRQRNLAAQGNE